MGQYVGSSSATTGLEQSIHQNLVVLVLQGCMQQAVLPMIWTIRGL